VVSPSPSYRLQSISGVSAINPLVAFYDVHGGKREVLLFYFVPDTTRDWIDSRDWDEGIFAYSYFNCVEDEGSKSKST
jgi:hypothetical protein